MKSRISRIITAISGSIAVFSMTSCVTYLDDGCYAPPLSHGYYASARPVYYDSGYHSAPVYCESRPYYATPSYSSFGGHISYGRTYGHGGGYGGGYGHRGGYGRGGYCR